MRKRTKPDPYESEINYLNNHSYNMLCDLKEGVLTKEEAEQVEFARKRAGERVVEIINKNIPK